MASSVGRNRSSDRSLTGVCWRGILTGVGDELREMNWFSRLAAVATLSSRCRAIPAAPRDYATECLGSNGRTLLSQSSRIDFKASTHKSAVTHAGNVFLCLVTLTLTL